VAQLGGAPPDRQEEEHGAAAARDYLTPEEAAAALAIHVQTLRAYVRSGKLPALRLAGERAIRIRRGDLDKVLEPLVPPA
jgi:excisionase family DNA binding protein